MVLQALRGDTVSQRTSVDELVAAARGAGQDITYHNYSVQSLTADRTHALTRAIQEGLTNASMRRERRWSCTLPTSARPWRS